MGGRTGGGGGKVERSIAERAASLALTAAGGGGIAGGVLLARGRSLSFVLSLPADTLIDAIELDMMDEKDAAGVYLLPFCFGLQLRWRQVTRRLLHNRSWVFLQQKTTVHHFNRAWYMNII